MKRDWHHGDDGPLMRFYIPYESDPDVEMEYERDRHEEMERLERYLENQK